MDGSMKSEVSEVLYGNLLLRPEMGAIFAAPTFRQRALASMLFVARALFRLLYAAAVIAAALVFLLAASLVLVLAMGSAAMPLCIALGVIVGLVAFDKIAG